MNIIKVEGAALKWLLDEIDYLRSAGSSVRTIRVAVDDDGTKVKVNELTWSRGFPSEVA